MLEGCRALRCGLYQFRNHAQKITFFQERLGTDYCVCKCRMHKIKCLASKLWLHPSTNSFQVDVQWGRGFKIADRRTASSSRALRWDVWLWHFVIQWKLICIRGLTVPKQDYPKFTSKIKPTSWNQTSLLCFWKELFQTKIITDQNEIRFTFLFVTWADVSRASNTWFRGQNWSRKGSQLADWMSLLKRVKYSVVMGYCSWSSFTQELKLMDSFIKCCY